MEFWNRALIKFFCICCGYKLMCEAEQIIKLDLSARASDKVWTARGLNGSKVIEVSASVPGGIYSDLEEAGGIYDTPIYYRYNDQETKWVGRTDWNFSREFEATEALLSKRKLTLVCEGLDTISNVYLNEKLIGSSENMFVRYIYDIKDAIKKGTNTLRFQFESPVLYADNQWNIQKKYYIVPPECNPDEYHGECHANHIRKMQASFAWDLGPSYPSSGIWRNIYIEGSENGVIRDVLIFMKPNCTKPDETNATIWKLTARVWYDFTIKNGTDTENEVNAIATVTLKPYSKFRNSISIVGFKKKITLKRKCDTTNTHDIVFIVPGDKVKLWWPNGYGKQSLYDLELNYTILNGPDEYSFKKIRVGFRTIELIQDLIDPKNITKGLSFYFKTNDIPIYAKGTNAIPAHILPERVTPEMTRWIFESAKEAYFNMIRVWGGGIYESEEFYQYADETGILIWQDFMFACAMYPTDPKYLKNVAAEVEFQVKRLQYHPSIAIWSANNENEAALRGNWYGTKENYTLYKNDFVKLYIDTVMKITNELDPSRICLSSSPTNGIESEIEGWIAKNPYSNYYGDVHFYNYTADGWDWKTFPKTRFASEYGYQSWPSIETLLTGISKDKDWAWNSSVIVHRQHHPVGQKEMEDQIQMHLPLPAKPNSTEAFVSMLYLAQINQAMSVKVETEFYRRLKGQMFESGEGENMGALYWQLNDIWQGASWASIENTGRWKMLHYYAKNFFAPFLISPYLKENGDISIYMVSDSQYGYTWNLRIRLFGLDSFIPIIDYKVPISVEPFSAREVHIIKSTDFEDCQNFVTVCLLYLSDILGVPDNFLYLEYPTHHSFIQDPKMKITSTAGEISQTFTVALESEAIAPFVFLSIKSNEIIGYFSDNGFNMIEPFKNVTFECRAQLSLEEFRRNLQVSSLYDVVS